MFTEENYPPKTGISKDTLHLHFNTACIVHVSMPNVRIGFRNSRETPSTLQKTDYLLKVSGHQYAASPIATDHSAVLKIVEKGNERIPETLYIIENNAL